VDNEERRKRIEGLTKIVARVSKPTPLTEALSGMRIVTTAGELQSAIHAYHGSGKRKYAPAPEHAKRGNHKGNKSNNAYPPEYKAKVLAEFDGVTERNRLTINYAEIARKYGIHRITVKRWADAYFASLGEKPKGYICKPQKEQS